MKKALKVILILVATLAIVFFGGFLIIRNQALKAQESLTFETVDMSQAADGDFTGEADLKVVQVKVSVTVKNHAIEKIELLEHKNGMGQKAEAITERMVGANSYEVDAVSGATLSSEAIKSAVSKALKASCAK